MCNSPIFLSFYFRLSCSRRESSERLCSPCFILGKARSIRRLPKCGGGLLSAGAELLAANLKLLGQLFQTEQLGGALGCALGCQLDGVGRFLGVELGVLRGFLGGLHGFVGLGAHHVGGVTGGQAGSAVAGLGSGQLELQAALVHLFDPRPWRWCPAVRSWRR